ncbi:GNAT family N-acetyltransferase [uncultured Croceitalea sp.]|uniref:GNAT family N-acetyltransferase n=1 Tax=uncultured Croceitalea sp. TaxID=1798908 RepID=UPI0033063797
MKNELKILRLKENNLDLFIELVTLFNEVFEEYHTIATKEHLTQLLGKPDFCAMAVIKNHMVVGGLTAYELERYYNDQSELYIYDIAVKTELHNQGIGKALIEFLKNYSTNNGIETIFVEAHTEDEQAVKFYEAIFGESEKVDHFNFEVKSAGNTE